MTIKIIIEFFIIIYMGKIIGIMELLWLIYINIMGLSSINISSIVGTI